ncbi:MAG TPA: hypothetical protein VN180_08275, partial [Acidimicrobiia bacterium]|nr:hypothetical protein [Acidimicrobiia bacterium]
MEVLCWPEDRARLDALTTAGQPCLLLVGPGPHPLIRSTLQDWVRLPVEPADLQARRATLAARAAARPRLAHTVDHDGILRYRGRWTALSSRDRALFDALAACVGQIVPTETLCRVGPARSAATLRVQLTRLRTRVAPLGLEIRAVRSRGYVLSDMAPDTGPGDAPTICQTSDGGAARRPNRSILA